LEPKRVAIGLAVVSIIIVASIVGLYLFVFQRPVANDVVGVVDIQGAILSSYFRDNLTKVIRYAIEEDSVKAVVLRIESPGGAASLVEELYLGVVELAKHKPVIASVQSIAASGGYYIAIAASYIYCQPTATVGSVGVLATEPEITIPVEGVLETGPYKEAGFSPLGFAKTLSLAFQNFKDAVLTRRGNRLKIDEKTLSQGMIYLGVEAVDLGLVDEIGSLNDAINRAASEVNLVKYDVSYLNALVLATTSQPSQGTSWTDMITRKALLESGEQSNLFFLYVPPNLLPGLSPERTSWLGWSASPDISTLQLGLGGGTRVVLDVAHQNFITMFETSIILKELVLRGATVDIVFTREDFLELTGHADALVIACPYDLYTDQEISSIENLVQRGGRVLLVGEPTRNVAFLNFVAMRFGLYYSHGYISDPDNSYFNYRNVAIRDLLQDRLTTGIQRLVLFTTTCIYSNGGGLAFTGSKAYSYPGETPGTFSPLARAGNGRVVALADLTMLTEPFVYVEDNYAFLQNIVSYLLGS